MKPGKTDQRSLRIFPTEAVNRVNCRRWPKICSGDFEAWRPIFCRAAFTRVLRLARAKQFGNSLKQFENRIQGTAVSPGSPSCRAVAFVRRLKPREGGSPPKRNPNLEYRNSKQARINEKENSKQVMRGEGSFRTFVHSKLFRISDLEF